MVKYRLMYFNVRAKAELARLLFAEAGVDYEDFRVEREEWPKLKPDMPLGQLPVLEIDGVKIPQSMAIGRYLAREFSFYGANNRESTQIDVVLDTVSDVLDLGVRYHFAEIDAIKEATLKQLVDKLPITCKFLTNLLTKNTSGFLVGSKVSIADLATYHFISWLKMIPVVDEELKKNAKITEHYNMVENRPKIKAWIEKRPVTSM